MSLRGVNISLLSMAEQKWLTLRTANYLNRVGCSPDQYAYIRSLFGTFENNLTPVKPFFLPDLIPRGANPLRGTIGDNPVNEIPLEAFTVAAQEPAPDIQAIENENQEDNPYTHDDIRDLELRYSRCLCKYKGEVYFLDSFRPGNNNKVDCYILKPKEDFSFAKEKLVRFDNNFDFTLPKLGYINGDKYCIHLLRNHKRADSTRYRRGFTTSSVVMAIPSKREIELSGIQHKYNTNTIPTERIIHALSSKIFDREYPTYNEALNKVLSFEMLSCAFSTTWCIKLDSVANKFVLLKNNWLIGEYNQKKGLWDIINPAFNIELDKLGIKYNEVTE